MFVKKVLGGNKLKAIQKVGWHMGSHRAIGRILKKGGGLFLRLNYINGKMCFVRLLSFLIENAEFPPKKEWVSRPYLCP